MTTSTTVHPTTSTRPNSVRRRGFVLLMVISIAFLAASSAPTPLYAIYQEQLDLAPVTVTVVFAVYALTLLIALLVAGSVSDYIGRRPVIIGSLLVEVGSLVVFLVADTVVLLIVARAIQGLATGVATAAVAAALTDLDARKAPLYNSIAPLIGLAVGAVGAAGLATTIDAPVVGVFTVLIVLFVILVMLASLVPESAAGRPGLAHSLRVSIAVPATARAAMLVTAPMFIAGWAIGGFILSLGPSLLHAESGTTSPMAGGWLVVALTASGAASVMLLHARAAHQTLIIGASAMIIGLGFVFISVGTSNAALLFIGTTIAGAGFGAGFQGAMRIVIPRAAAHERAGLLSTIYIISYLSMGVIAIAAGLLTAALNVQGATLIIGSLSTLLAVGALIGAAGKHPAVVGAPADQTSSPMK